MVVFPSLDGKKTQNKIRRKTKLIMEYFKILRLPSYPPVNLAINCG